MGTVTLTGNTIQAHCHPDFLRLEDELCRRIGTLLEPRTIPRVLVFTITTRQQKHLQQVLANRFKGLLGVDVLTHYTYVRRLTEARGIRTIPTVLQEAVLSHLVQEGPGNQLNQYLRDFPTGVSRIATLFDELREGLVTSEALASAAAGDTEQFLARLFADYEKALNALAGLKGPYLDRGGRTQLATKLAGQQLPVTAVFQYGAHELLAMNQALITAIPCSGPIQWLGPVDEKAGVWEYARKTLERVTAEITYLKDDSPRAFVTAARCFCDWDAPAAKLPPESIQLLNAQGPESEIQTVARQIMQDLFHGGFKSTDIAVIARSLEPYAPSLEAVFRRHHIPVDSSLKTPLSREPNAHTFTAFLKALESALERQAVIDLARSPGLVPRGDNFMPDWWDSWSRKARLVRGHSAWNELAETLALRGQSPKSAHEHILESAQELKRFIADLEKERTRWYKARTAREHVALLTEWVDSWIQEGSGDLHKTLSQLETLDTATQTLEAKSHKLNPRTVLQYVQRIFQEEPVPWSTPGGVHVLDVMQARGLVFRKVYWIGFNAAWLPQAMGEDAFLGDTTRKRLGTITGLPVNVHKDTILEERMLFAQTAICAQEHLQVSWQRADAEGRSMTPSLYLDQVHRVVSREDERVPTHPKASADWQLKHTGLLFPSEGALLSTWGSGRLRDRAMREFTQAVSLEHLGPHLDFVTITDQSRGTDLRYDSLITQSGSWADRFSPSSLERMGGCPHQYFYRSVLGIRPLREEAEESGVDSLDVGNLIHKVLELAFPELPTSSDTHKTLEKHFDAVFKPARERMVSRYPLAWDSLQTAWLRELTLFVDADLDRFIREGWSFSQGEQTLEKEISLVTENQQFLPPSITFCLHGKLDRVATNNQGDILVSDYKTGGKIEDWTRPASYLRGQKLQLSLYELLAQPDTGDIQVELLGIGPKFQPERGFVHTGPVSFNDKYNRGGMEETIALLVHFARTGKFPINPQVKSCGYCDFDRACRKAHIATADRIDNAPEFLGYRLTQKKNKSKPLLAMVLETKPS